MNFGLQILYKSIAKLGIPNDNYHFKLLDLMGEKMLQRRGKNEVHSKQNPKLAVEVGQHKHKATSLNARTTYS